MGSWSAALFSNDTTCDVRDTYMECLRQQLSDEAAYEKTYQEYSELMKTDEEPLFWYAMAYTQWKLGRLSEIVKETALNWIDKKGGLDLYEENKKAGIRFLERLRKLQETINSPMPPRKIIRKPREYIHDPWNVGDVYAYQFHTKDAEDKGFLNHYIVFQKVGKFGPIENRSSIVQVYDRIFDHVPTLTEIRGIRILPLTSIPNERYKTDREYRLYWGFEKSLQVMMECLNAYSYPTKYLTYVGNQFVQEKEFLWGEFGDFVWERNGMEEWLIAFYLEWQGIEY